MVSEPSFDWPLSRDEQRKQVIRLYDKDVRAADQLLHSGEAALQALRRELAMARAAQRRAAAAAAATFAARRSALAGEDLPQDHEGGFALLMTPQGSPEHSPETRSPATRWLCESPPRPIADGSAAEVAERLQLAVANAAAALVALAGHGAPPEQLAALEDIGDAPPRPRSRSEGASRASEAPVRSALLSKERRRTSRGRRVSFAEDVGRPRPTETKALDSAGGAPAKEDKKRAALVPEPSSHVHEEIKRVPVEVVSMKLPDEKWVARKPPPGLHATKPGDYVVRKLHLGDDAPVPKSPRTRRCSLYNSDTGGVGGARKGEHLALVAVKQAQLCRKHESRRAPPAIKALTNVAAPSLSAPVGVLDFL
mmetsp:Transcript_6439/g.18433  ORF Transcript_6439/g.18433 Transcript_6439/m.18433 type:complete len:367 (+) Transcript_6439:98-1198(+)